MELTDWLRQTKLIIIQLDEQQETYVSVLCSSWKIYAKEKKKYFSPLEFSSFSNAWERSTLLQVALSHFTLPWMTWGMMLRQCFCMGPLCTPWEWKTTSIHDTPSHVGTLEACFCFGWLSSFQLSTWERCQLFSLENRFSLENVPGTHHPSMAYCLSQIWRENSSEPQGGFYPDLRDDVLLHIGHIKGYVQNLWANMSNTVSIWFSTLPVPDHLSPSLLCKSHIGCLFPQRLKAGAFLIFFSSHVS